MESYLAIRQHDVEYVGDFAFDPQVPAGTQVQPKLIPYPPKQWACIKREMAEPVAYGVVKCSEDVACMGRAVLVEGKKKDRSTDSVPTSII